MRIIRNRQNGSPPFGMDWRGVGMQRVWHVCAHGDGLNSRDGLTRSERPAWRDRLARSDGWRAVTGGPPVGSLPVTNHARVTVEAARGMMHDDGQGRQRL